MTNEADSQDLKINRRFSASTCLVAECKEKLILY